MGGESQNRMWSVPQITEIKVKLTEKKHDSNPPNGNHYGKNAANGHDAFSLGHES